MTELTRCSRCLLPETHETIVFDAAGVCGVCRNADAKGKIDWSARKSKLNALIDDYRGKHDYDCIVPFSGGKDSTWTLLYLVKECNVKPLVVTFDHGFLRSTVQANTKRTLRKLGVDHLVFTPNWHVVRRLMLHAFIEKGDFCWHCHTGIFSYPMWVALEKHVPLIIWGEPSAEYTSYYGYEQHEEVDDKRFNRFVNLGISADDMWLRLDGTVAERDLKPFRYPPVKDLRRIGYRSVCLGSFIPWDVKAQSEIIRRDLGWEGDEVEGVPPDYSHEKIECFLQGVRDYIKFVKRGYSRPTHLASIDVRNGRLSRDQAERIVDEYEGRRPASLDVFLEYVGLTEVEFVQVAASHAVSPWDGRIPIKIGKKPHDFGEWPRGDGLPPEDAPAALKRMGLHSGAEDA